MTTKEEIFFRASSGMLLAFIFMAVGVGVSDMGVAKKAVLKERPSGISPPEKSKAKIQTAEGVGKVSFTAAINYQIVDLSDEPIYVREEYGTVVAQG